MASNETQTKGKTMKASEAKAKLMAEITNMSGREEIEKRMESEDNDTYRIWIWQYLQTL